MRDRGRDGRGGKEERMGGERRMASTEKAKARCTLVRLDITIGQMCVHMYTHIATK